MKIAIGLEAENYDCNFLLTSIPRAIISTYFLIDYSSLLSFNSFLLIFQSGIYFSTKSQKLF